MSGPAMGDAVALLGDAAMTSASPSRALQQVARRLGQVVSADVVAVFDWSGGDWVQPVAVARSSSRAPGHRSRPWSMSDLSAAARHAAARADPAPEADAVSARLHRREVVDSRFDAVVLHVAGAAAGIVVVAGTDAGAPPDAALLRLAGERAATLLAVRQLEQVERRHRLGMEHARRHLALLVRAGDALAGAVTDLRPALQAVGDVVVPMFADWFAVDLLPVGSGGVPVGPEGVPGSPRPGGRVPRRRAERIVVVGDGILARPPVHRHPDGERLVGTVLAGGRSEMVVRRPPEGGDHLPGPELGAALPAGAAESMVAVPIRMRGSVVGAASFVTGAGRRGYRLSDLRVAEDLADRIGVTVERVWLWHAHRRAALDAEANQRRLHAVAEASPLAIVELDSTAGPVWWNLVAQRLLGWSDPVAGAPVVTGAPEVAADMVGTEPVHPAMGADPARGEPAGMAPLRRCWERACQGAEVVGQVVSCQGGDGSPMQLSVSVVPLRSSDGLPSGAVAMIEDVTERQRMVDRFHQADRLQAMARLAGSVAHDFNNLLTVVLGSCEILVDRMDPADPLREEVHAIRAAGQRAADLTSQLLSIGHRRPLRPVEIDPDSVLRSMHSVLDRVVGSSVEVEHVAPGSPATILVEPAELERAVLNLALNARDAMVDGGRLTLGTRRRVVAGNDRAPAAVVDVWVADTGCGMGPDTVARCFEPFFTTKPGGSGTGLGLAGVHAAVTAAGGTVTVESRIGEGTTFTLTFPAADAEPGPPLQDSAGDATAESPLDEAGSGAAPEERVVLVVDDDDGARRAAVQVLVRQGYLVVAAADAEEALDAVVSATDQLALLVTDVCMPGMGGRELAARLVTASPQLPVLYMTGDVQAADLAAGADVLAKPFRPEELARRVRRALAGAGSAVQGSKR